MSAIHSTSDETGAVACSEIRKIGYLRKLKTMKKKFFVLRAELGSQPARLEYYENEKKWKTGAQPKRNIVLKTCFNINRKLDIKQKHAIALYTKDDCFTLIMDNEEELEEWLNTLLALQHGDDALATDQPPKPTFEHVWQVNVRNRGLANSKNIIGPYHLCLTSQTLSLVKLNTESPQTIEFPLMSIRRCGHSYCFFFMELGRSAVTGSGELWMQTEDIIIAQNMHETILNAMRSTTKDDVTPRQRTRSSSTNEASKPISVHMRRQATVVPPGPISSTATRRERSDSVPSRPRTISEGPQDGAARKSQPMSLEIQRPHSMYSHVSSYSPPLGGSRVASPGSAPYATDSAGSSVSIDEHESYQFDTASHQLLMPTPDSFPRQSSITEESRFEDYLPMTPPDSSTKSEDTFDGNVGHVSPSRLFRVASGGRPRTPSTPLAMVGNSGKPTSPQLLGYMHMSSSLTNSPSDSEGYMAMSPVGSFHPSTPPTKSLTSVKSYLPMSPTGSTGEGSRKTSVDETANGYVSMAPLGTSKQSIPPDSEGYMDMKPTTPNAAKTSLEESYLDMVPNASPATSGTPATDFRFSEFQLEKVRTYFTANEEEEDEKLVRAYSMGSKIRTTNDTAEVNQRKTSPSRVRAFSVGSRVGVQFGKKRTVESVSAAKADSDSNGGKKSLSAPLLNISSAGSLGKTNVSKKEDLMELDFAKSGTSGRASAESHAKNAFRPRTNSRSSKAEWLQVIGESSYPALEQQTQKKENNYNDMQTNTVNNNNNSKSNAMTNEKKPSDAHLKDYVQMENKFDEMKISRKDSPPYGGEYVNIDLGRRNEKREKEKCNDQHEYVNLQVGNSGLTDDQSKQSSKTMPKRNNQENSRPHKSSNQLPSIGAVSNNKCFPLTDGDIDREIVPATDPASSIVRVRRNEDDVPYENISFERTNSRPTSVSSDKELNYASLDLAPIVGSPGEDEQKKIAPPASPATGRTNQSSTNDESEMEKLSYARIDFTKSEGLRSTLRDVRQ